MKPCPHCGKELPQEMQFCPYCMEKLITETVIGDTPIRRRRRWLWLVILLLLLLLLCSLWLWRPWPSPPDPEKESTIASTGSSVTTTSAVASADPSATQTTTPSQITPATTTTTQSVAATHTTAATGVGTSTVSPTAATGVSTSTVSPTATSGGISTTAMCAAGHDWQAVTQTVHVDEVGHYEKKTVEKRVTLYRCALCYEEHGSLEDYYAHFDAEHDGDSLEIVFRDRYETFEEYREVEEQTWVVDTPAYDKTITVGRRCRDCEKTEDNQ